jgi:ABC-type arginine transport system permease subunit
VDIELTGHMNNWLRLFKECVLVAIIRIQQSIIGTEEEAYI